MKSTIKLEILANKATLQPPIGPILGQYGIQAGKFCQEFNDQTKHFEDYIILSVKISQYNKKILDIRITPNISKLLQKLFIGTRDELDAVLQNQKKLYSPNISPIKGFISSDDDHYLKYIELYQSEGLTFPIMRSTHCEKTQYLRAIYKKQTQSKLYKRIAQNQTTNFVVKQVHVRRKRKIIQQEPHTQYVLLQDLYRLALALAQYEIKSNLNNLLDFVFQHNLKAQIILKTLMGSLKSMHVKVIF